MTLATTSITIWNSKISKFGVYNVLLYRYDVITLTTINCDNDDDKYENDEILFHTSYWSYVRFDVNRYLYLFYLFI